MTEKVIRVFVSSPADAMDERRRVEIAAARLNGQFERRVKIEVVRWETHYYSAHATFQKQIPEAAACDVVIAVFRGRLGTELPPGFPKLPNGEAYPSGTAYEVLSAIEVRRGGKGLPDVYVFRCSKPPLIELDDPQAAAVRAEWERLKAFFDTWFRTPGGQFVAAFQNFTSTDDFASQVEDCLRQWLARHGCIEHGPTWDRLVNGPPFPGLVPYEAKAESVFFGRYLDIVHAVARLREAGERGVPFLLLIGASDAGKSSLLRAGILPELVRPGTVPEIGSWRQAIAVPGLDPLGSLANALFADGALGPELAQGDFDKPELLAHLFRAGDADASVAPIRAALARAAAARAAELNECGVCPCVLALGIDQAERLFLESNAGVADIFDRILATLVKSRCAYVIVALRSDAYPRFQVLDSLRELRAKGAQLDLVPPGAAELQDIVVRPVAACTPPLAYEIRDGRSLADVLVEDAKGQDVLPLLQMALARLFEGEAKRGDGVLRFADYSGLGQAVSQVAQNVLATLDEPARAHLPALIMALVGDVFSEPGTGALIPVVSGFERGEFERQNPPRRRLVDAFLANRLLTVEDPGGAAHVRPAHDALLRIWPEAAGIISKNMAAIRVRHLLRPIVVEWAAAAECDKPGFAALPPALMGGAQQVIEVCGEDVKPDMRAFIDAALRHDTDRRKRAEEQHFAQERAQAAERLAASERRLFQTSVMGLVIVAVLAVGVGVLWREAQTQRKLAEDRLAAAVRTSNSLVSDFASRFRNTAGVPIGLIQDILERVSQFQEDLGEVSPPLRQSKADAQSELAATLLKLGNTKLALERAREAQDIYRSLAAATPRNPGFQRGLAWSARQVGDVLKIRGDLDGAFDRYAESRAISIRLYHDNPGSADWQHDLTEIHNRIGNVLVAQNKIAEARRAYEEGLKIAKVPIGGNGDAPRWESDLAWSYSYVGDVDVLQNSIEDALAQYAKSLRIRKALVAKAGDNVERQQDLWRSENKFAEALKAEGALAKAYVAYDEGRNIVEQLADRDKNNAEWRYDVSLSYSYLGEILARQNRIEEARSAYRRSLAIADALVRQDHDNTDWRLQQIEVNLHLAETGDDAAARLDFAMQQLAGFDPNDRRAHGLLELAKEERAKM